MAVDDSGNVYLTGWTTLSDGTTGYGTVKYSTEGRLLWASTFGGPGHEGKATGIVVDSAGYVYVTGENGPSTSSRAIVTIKYSPRGETVWVQEYNQFVSAGATGIAKDPYGNIYVMGWNQPGWDSGKRDFITLKYSGSGGNPLWVMGRSVGVYCEPGAIVADSHYVYVAGRVKGLTLILKYSLDADVIWDQYYGNGDGSTGGFCGLAPDKQGNLYLTTYKAQADMLYVTYCATVKYSPQGNILWEKLWRSGVMAAGLAICLVSDSGWVYVTGSYSVDGTALKLVMITIKYDSLGNELWVNTHGASGGVDQGRAVATDRRGNAYVAGYSKVPAGNSQTLTLKYSSGGNEEWARTDVGPSADNCADRIVVDRQDNVYVSGWSDKNSSDPYDMDYVAIKYSQKGRFKPDRDGWSFPNSSNPPMWTLQWYSQFNYGQSPPYPGTWTTPPINAMSADFPDWPLFVYTFGEDSCYFPSVGKLIYRPRAVQSWRRLAVSHRIYDTTGHVVGHWKGACYGFCITAHFFYNDYLSVRSVFPSRSSVFEVPDAEDLARVMVNSRYLVQYSADHVTYIGSHMREKGLAALSEVQTMLNSTTTNDRFVIIFNQHGKGGHAVVPCRLSSSPSTPTIDSLYIYDCNYPGVERAIVFNSSAGTWDDSDYPNWGDTAGIFLSEQIRDFLARPAIPQKADIERAQPIIAAAPSGSVLLQTPGPFSTLIENPAGEWIGFDFSSGRTLDSMAGAYPVIPITGHEDPPMGFIVPEGSYKILISKNLDTLTQFFCVSAPMDFTYWRNKVDRTETDEILIGGSGFTMVNPDPALKTIAFSGVSGGVADELSYTFSGVALGQKDSLALDIREQYRPMLVNPGSARQYDLGFEFAAASVSRRFFHPGISIGTRTAHIIVPSLPALDSVWIYSDVDMDGTIDDTIVVENTLTGIGQLAPSGRPMEFRLEQNYPNPFNATTVVRFQLPVVSDVRLAVYDLLGREVAVLVNEKKTAGSHEVRFDAPGLSSGVYFYRLEAGGFVQTRKLMLLK
jgi:hypothetical protein